MAKELADKKPAAAPQAQHAEPKPAPMKAGAKGHNPMPDGCHAVSCKTKAARFNFCDEHYDQFKFGLIKKTGEPVSDFDKKIDHYQAYKKKLASRKVA